MHLRLFLIVLLIKFILIMPIPKPNSKEKQKDFMIRCVPQMMKEYKKDQAIAICIKEYSK